MFFLLIVVLALLPYQGFGDECRVCPKDFTYYEKEDKCYRVYDTKETFDKASKTCQGLGSHLVILEKASDNELLKQISQPISDACKNVNSGRPAVWNAAKKDCSKESTFFWTPSDAVLIEMGYTNWYPGQPSPEVPNENCVQIFLDDDQFRWNDIRCESPNCYICEFDM